MNVKVAAFFAIFCAVGVSTQSEFINGFEKFHKTIKYHFSFNISVPQKRVCATISI